MTNPIDITGQRFGRLTAIVRAQRKSLKGAVWLFRCDCGTEKEATAAQVRSGRTRSCGCLRRETAAALGGGGVLARSSSAGEHTGGLSGQP